MTLLGSIVKTLSYEIYRNVSFQTQRTVGNLVSLSLLFHLMPANTCLVTF